MAVDAESQSSSNNIALKDLNLNHNSSFTESGDSKVIDEIGFSASNGVTSQTPVNGLSSIQENVLSYAQNALTPMDHDADDLAGPKSLEPSITETLTFESTVVEQPTSNLREPTEPASSNQATEIKEQRHQQDLAQDIELANGLAEGGDAPIERNPVLGSIPASRSENGMDVMSEDVTSVADNIDPPHHPAIPTVNGALPEAPLDPAPTPVIQESPPVQEDHVLNASATSSSSRDRVMQDVPQSPSKVARSRDEEDDEDRPATKRLKGTDGGSQEPEFKVPDLPQPVSEQANGTAMTDNSANISTQVQDGADATPPKPITKTQHKFLLKGLQNMRRTKDAALFNKPVDYVALNLPSYPEHVKHPIDLGTMEEKLKAARYASVAAYIADFEQMVQNTIIFNGVDHPVTRSAQSLKESLSKHMSNLPPDAIPEPQPVEKKSKKTTTAAPKQLPQRRESRSSLGNTKSPVATSSPQTFALGPQGVPLIRRDSTATDGRPKREIHPPAPRDLPYSNQKPKKKKYQWELKFCQEVISELRKQKYTNFSWPFLNPVDPVALNIPHYHKVIKKPMDVGTVEKKLKEGQYENAKEFEGDIRLIFQNCYKFNPPADAVHQQGRNLERVFDDKWAEKRQWIEDHAPASGPHSPGSSPEPEDDDEEEDEEEEEEESEISILQKQIAAMSKQVELIQKKKSSPPVLSKKASKGGKPAKKETKKGTSNAPIKREPPKPTKKAKVPYVTYEQKQDISIRINTLPESRMATALSIIRDNMPNLKGVQEDEIELDIDELSNDVLYKLLTFVRKYAPLPTDSPEPRQVAAPAAAAPSRPKKNKPMSKNEQEAKIQEIRGKLSGFNQPDESPEPAAKAQPADETSGDEDDSEESEED